MSIDYYAFALFIAVLICLIAIILRVLFANVRRQRKLLDEKETKLLQLYRTVENIMEEFNDQISTAMDDIKEHETRAAEHIASMSRQQEQVQPEETTQQPQQTDKPSKAMTVDSSRIRAASEVLERAERMIKSGPGKKTAPAAISNGGGVIQRLFDDSPGEQQDEDAETGPQAKFEKRDSILAFAKEGRTYAQIARELGITQNEVKLVIELGGAAIGG